MDDTDNKVYELYDEDTTSAVSGLLSCLYTYTIGSCLYFKNGDASSVSDGDEIELTPMISTGQKGADNGGTNMNSSNEWKKAECRMKKRIKYHFTDHIRRWIMDSDQRRFPWKLILHLLLVALVTTQVSLYAVDRTKLTKFLIESTDAINQYFRSANHNEEILLYKINDVYDQIERIVENYYSLPDQFLAVSSICYHNNKNKPEILNMSVKYLEIQDCPECGQNLSGTFPDTLTNYNVKREIFLPANNSDSLMNEFETTACDNNSICCTSGQCHHSIRDQVKYFINMDNLYRISQVLFNLTLNTTYQKGVIEDYNAVEVNFSVDIRLNGHNHLHSSHVDVEVVVEPLLKRLCDRPLRARTTVIDSVVIVLAMLASIGYLLSVIRSIRLAKDVKLHFLVYHKKKLGWEEINILFNKFYILMLFTCFLLIVTSILKIISEYTEKIHLRLVEEVSILLGIGVFLLWCGLFGFLKYFESLNVLLITLKLAVPSVLRFAVCMAILFLAFTFCGWLIIGPYNPQFDNPWVAAETLIGIVNGDGIADAFSATSSDSVANSVKVVIISKLYLILFVFIFIYIVLSLFIGIFDHAYDSLSAHWRNRSRGFLWDWAEEQEEDDLTKNYPFPVPRIRDLSGELRIECCKWHSHLASMPKNKSRKVTAVANPAPLQSLTTASDDGDYTSSDENTRKEQKSVAHYSSDSKLQPPGHVQPPRHEHIHYSVRNPRRYRGTTRFSSRRHRSFVKSIVKEPPDASQQEVAKAKRKLLHKSQHLEMNMLEEDDL